MKKYRRLITLMYSIALKSSHIAHRVSDEDLEGADESLTQTEVTLVNLLYDGVLKIFPHKVANKSSQESDQLIN